MSTLTLPAKKLHRSIVMNDKFPSQTKNSIHTKRNTWNKKIFFDMFNSYTYRTSISCFLRRSHFYTIIEHKQKINCSVRNQKLIEEFSATTSIASINNF